MRRCPQDRRTAELSWELSVTIRLFGVSTEAQDAGGGGYASEVNAKGGKKDDNDVDSCVGYGDGARQCQLP